MKNINILKIIFYLLILNFIIHLNRFKLNNCFNIINYSNFMSIYLLYVYGFY